MPAAEESSERGRARSELASGLGETDWRHGAAGRPFLDDSRRTPVLCRVKSRGAGLPFRDPNSLWTLKILVVVSRLYRGSSSAV